MFFTYFFLFVCFLGDNLLVHVWSFGGGFVCLFVFAILHHFLDLISPTRDRSWAPCGGSEDS